MQTIRWILTLMFCVVAYAAAPVRINSPGVTGMVSATDIGENRPTDSRWTLNGDIATTPGSVNRRRGFITVGDNSTQTYAAFGIASTARQRKQILAAVAGPDSVMVSAIGTDYLFDSSGASVRFVVSDTFGSGTQDDTVPVGGIIFQGRDIGAVEFLDRTIIYDGITIPAVYCDESPFATATMSNPDTFAYSPRMVSLGTEAPGQPRVGVIAKSSPLTGWYRYSYRFVVTGTVQWAAIASRWVYVDSQQVYITAFQSFPRATGGLVQDTLYLVRQKFNGEWMQCNTPIIFRDTSQLFVMDSGGGTWVAASGPDTKPSSEDSVSPGALLCFSATYDTIQTVNGIAHRAYIDSTYYVGYSYYDPVLDIESPISHLTKGPLVKVSAGDTMLVRWDIPWTKTSERPKWIRVYRSRANDSTVLYGLWELRADSVYPKAPAKYPRSMFPGWSSDTELALGQPFMWDTATNTYPYSSHWCEILLDDDGGALVRPPLQTSLEIPFSTMAAANNRLWGAGDPLYPNRVYYSEYDELTGWLATDYIECGESSADEIVALIALSVGVEDALLVFRHNDIWIITGYDNERSVYPTVQAPARARYRLTDKCGTVSRKNTVLANDMVYFLSPNMKIYRTNGSEPEDIGQPIENYIDSYFVSFAHADSHVVAFRLEDRVVWYDSTVNRSLAYNLYMGTWGVESYGADFRPAGSFAYDTAQNVWGKADRSYWLYQSDSACQFRTEYSGYVDSTDTVYSFPFNVQPPAIGDGVAFYSILEAQVTATLTGDTAGTYLVGYVIDETGDTVAVDSAEVFGYSTVRMGFPRHVGRYLSLRLGVSGDNTAAEIHDVALYPVKVAETRTR